MEYSKFGYKLPLSSLAHALALDSRWLEIARTHWVMYPDHAVFLGGRAAVATDESETAFVIVAACRPPCIIIPGRGVVVRDDLTPGGEAMLTVYPEVIARIPAEVDVRSLNDSQVAALLNWDAEKYRQSLDKSSKSSG